MANWKDKTEGFEEEPRVLKKKGCEVALSPTSQALIHPTPNQASTIAPAPAGVNPVETIAKGKNKMLEFGVPAR